MSETKRPTVRVYVEFHGNEAAAAEPTTCGDYEQGGAMRRGCGRPLFRYTTYPNGKGMRFDAPVEEVPDTRETVTEPLPGIVARVYSENNHFATCEARKAGAQ